MLILVVLVLGFIALSRLPVDLMPDITYPTLNVSTSYPNTAPEEMEQIITRPIEEALSSVPGVEEIFQCLLRAAVLSGLCLNGEQISTRRLMKSEKE